MLQKQNRITALRRQIKRLEQHISWLEDTNRRFVNLRLGIVLLGIPLLIIFIFTVHPIAVVVAAITVVASFFTTMTFHQHVRDRLEAHNTWIAIKNEQLARMTLDWDAIPPSRVTNPEGHPFATDLNTARLHRLMNTATTKTGIDRLFDWLLVTSPDLNTIRERQAILKELIPKSIFRIRLELNGRLGREKLRAVQDSNQLQKWFDHSPPAHLKVMTLVLAVLASINIASFIVFSLDLIPPIWIFTWLAYGLLFAFQRRGMGDLFKEAMSLLDLLETTGRVMVFLEQYKYRRGSRLESLCAPIAEASPSQKIRQISWTASGASLQGNPMLWLVVNAVLPWDLLVAQRLYRQQEHIAKHLPTWLEIWYELEALSSLASFAYQNPPAVFPEIDQQGPVFVADGIGHPFIPESKKIRNDFSFNKMGEVRIVTGSNMSGKSTFLRTLGINVCLSYAGGTVDAMSLKIQPLRQFTCIQITDSLEDGISYFYAEVKRLKALLDELQAEQEQALFFLIDEIFRGTNNRERLIGSQAYLRALIGLRGVGLIATHDLELVQLADDHVNIQNLHFEESIIEGRMVFDYQLRPGASPTTNALKIMQLEGLPVE